MVSASDLLERVFNNWPCCGINYTRPATPLPENRSKKLVLNQLDQLSTGKYKPYMQLLTNLRLLNSPN